MLSNIANFFLDHRFNIVDIMVIAQSARIYGSGDELGCLISILILVLWIPIFLIGRFYNDK